MGPVTIYFPICDIINVFKCCPQIKFFIFLKNFKKIIYSFINLLDKICLILSFVVHNINIRPKQQHHVFIRKGPYSHWHTHKLTASH